MQDIKHLKVGDAVQYDSPTVINNHHWIWQGTVTRVTWKYCYITWTHSNSPVFPGPIVENDKPVTKAVPRTKNGDLYTLIVPPAPVPVVADEVVNADTNAEYEDARINWDQVITPAPEPVQVYKVVQTIEGKIVVTMPKDIYSWAVANGRSVYQVARISHLRATCLTAQPCIEGLCGPMWDGFNQDGLPVIRYEDQTSNDTLSI